VVPEAQSGDDPHAQMLSARPASDYCVHLTSGGELRGSAIGHVETRYGLFLFPPLDERGAGRRLFIPKNAYGGCEVGPRIGDVLVEQNAATPQQIERAAEEQHVLRSRKLGDILVTRHVVTPEQLVAALDKQASMPMVRIGEALTALGLISEGQL